MLQEDVNRQPIQLLVNYWEIPPARMGARLDELLRRGVTNLVSFIPWQAIESDISHSLTRFLQAMSERKMTISLVLTPEVSVHYPYSGLPKDIFSKPENTARNEQSCPMPMGLAPHIFNLPSLHSPEFLKRYHGFLSRLDRFFTNLNRVDPHLFKGVTAILTGSYWKYYRCHKEAALHPLGATAGDYSSSAGVAFRQFLELYYSQKEFQMPHPSVSNRWKSQALEDLNRRIFYQHSEDLFRNRSTQYLLRKSLPVDVLQFELYSLEADPSFFYSNFLSSLTHMRADFSRLSVLLDEMSSRSSYHGDQPNLPFVHWSSLGPFHVLTESEKLFLILKSLLLFGGRGGGILIDESEWFSLSHSFKSRIESLSRQMMQGALRLKNRAFFLTPHLWSDGGDLWDELKRRVGSQAQAVASIDSIVLDKEVELVIVDPAFVLTQEGVMKLMHWARKGGVVALPRSPFYTEAGRAEVEHHLLRSESLEINLGIPYRIQHEGAGKVLLYDLPKQGLSKVETINVWEIFIGSLLSVSEILPHCQVTDDRLKVLSFEKEKENEKALFILNGGVREVSASVVFPENVLASDLASSFTREQTPPSSPAVPSHRFSLEAPPFGILSLSVESMPPPASEFQAENPSLWN